MKNHEPSPETEATGYFKATQNGVEIFRSDRAAVYHEGRSLIIEGSINLGFPNGRAFNLSIDPDTPSGSQMFLPGGELRQVYYLNGATTVYAYAGSFDANLNNITKEYRITFTLDFHGMGKIYGVVEVTE